MSRRPAPAAALLCAALCAALPQTARAGDGKDPSALIEKAIAELEAWDIPAAVGVLDDLVQADPDGPATAWLRGRVLFEQGKYEEALAAYDDAQTRAQSGSATSSHVKAAVAAEVSNALAHDRALAKSTAAEVKGDKVHESAHFILRTTPGKDLLLVPYALAGLERAWAALSADLGYEPKEKIRVEVYESAQALARVSPLTVAEIKASGTIALCKYNRLMITSPRALLRGYPWLDTLSHELVHFLVTKKGRGTVPIWLQEGLAKFLETRWRGPPGLAVDPFSTALLHKAAKTNSLIPFKRMHPSIAKLPTQEAAALAFAEVEAAIKLLYDRGGQQALTELVAAMAHGFDDQAAVAQAYGKSFANFEADWAKDVARPRAGQAAAGAVRTGKQKKLVFREDAKGRPAPADPHAGESAEPGAIADGEAKKAYRLGDILFARRRWGAAALEYNRARARVKDTVPALSRRYALACLQTNKPDEALTALLGATQVDPQDEAAQALLARVRVVRGEFDKARDAVEAGLAVDPFDPDLHASYVQIAEGLKDEKLLGRERAALHFATTSDARLREELAKKPGGTIEVEFPR